MKKMRPLIRYPGSKTLLSQWIINHFPEHDTYNEPFAGSAAILLNKPRSRMETVNDLSDELINMLIMFREHPDKLIQKIEKTYWAKAEWELAQQLTEDPIEQARRFYVRCWMSRRPFDNSPAFRRQKKLSLNKDGKGSMTPAAKTFMNTQHLYEISKRLRGVAIENMDGIEFIKLYDYDKAFFYVDPPYPFDTRKSNGKLYPVDNMNEDAHVELFEVLNAIEGAAVVSGYACDLYANTYEESGWRRVDKEARIDGDRTAVESLWLSPGVWEGLQQKTVKQGVLL